MNSGSWIRQELRRWLANPTRLLLVVAPLAATALCLLVYSARTVRELPVAVVDQDGSSLSRTIQRDLDAAPQIQVVQVANADEAMDGFLRGRFRAVAILPEGMDREVRMGRTAKVVFWRDATNPMTANQLYSATATIVATEGARLVAGRLMVAGLTMSQAKEMAMPLRTDPRGFSNPSLDYLSNFAPGLFPVFLQMALMLTAGSMLPHGWKRSARPLRELLARSIPWIVVYGVAAIVYYLFVLPRMGAPTVALVPMLALVAMLFAASILCGAVFGRLIQSPVKAGQYLLAFNTPAFPLSGYTFPEWAMPPILQAIARPLPFSLFIDAYRGLAGWATDRPIVAWWGLAAWIAATLAILLVPGKGGGEETEPVSRPAPVTGGFPHALRREFRRLTRTPGLSTIFLVAPALYMALYGAMYMGKEERRIPLAVVDGSNSAISREISNALSAHPLLDPIPMTSSDAREALRRNEIRGVLEMPRDIDVRIRRREATAIPLLFVADRFLPANDLQRSIGEVLSSFGTRERLLILQAKGLAPVAARERATALSLDDRAMGNPRETYGDFMLPLLGILILHQICLVGSAFASAASAGAHRFVDFAARTLLFTLWYGGWLAVWVGLVLPAMSVPLDPQIAPLVLLSVLGFAGASLMGSIAGMLIGEPGAAAQLLAFTSYPLFFASGSSWPREMFPTLVDWFGKIAPLSPWITAGNRAMRLDAGVRETLPELAHLGVLAVGSGLALWAACRFLSWRASRDPASP